MTSTASSCVKQCVTNTNNSLINHYNYGKNIADKATAKTTSGHASNYMINHKIQELQAQIEELKKQIKD